jgi:hypothetical protein
MELLRSLLLTLRFLACRFLTLRFLALLLLASSCSGPIEKKPAQEDSGGKDKQPIIKKPASSYNDTVRVTTDAAVFYSPDSTQMEKIRSVNQKATFDMIVHDCWYQMKNAREVLRTYWPKVRVVDVSQARYLLFEKADKSRICIDLDEKNDICGIFLFNRKKAPALIDMPNVNTALDSYFKR